MKKISTIHYCYVLAALVFTITACWNSQLLQTTCSDHSVVAAEAAPATVQAAAARESEIAILVAVLVAEAWAQAAVKSAVLAAVRAAEGEYQAAIQAALQAAAQAAVQAVFQVTIQEAALAAAQEKRKSLDKGSKSISTFSGKEFAPVDQQTTCSNHSITPFPHLTFSEEELKPLDDWASEPAVSFSKWANRWARAISGIFFNPLNLQRAETAFEVFAVIVVVIICL